MIEVSTMSQPSSSSHRLLPCYIGTQAYAVDTRRLRGIRRSDGMSFRPEGDRPHGRLPDGVEVESLQCLLEPGSMPDRTAARRVLVFEGDARRWGLLVDRVERAFDISADRIHPIPQIARGSGPLRAAVLREERIYLVATHETLRAARQGERPVEDISAHPAAQDRAPSRAGEAESAGSGHIVIFSTGAPEHRTSDSVDYALSVSQIVEVTRLQPWTRLPDPRARSWG